MSAALLHQDWVCARGCTAVARTYDAKVPHHRCRQMGGLMVPLIRAGTRAKVDAWEREDYIGRDVVALSPQGRPVMAIVTTRDEGQDCRVLAPCAVASREELG